MTTKDDSEPGKIEVSGDIGSGAAVGHGASVTAGDIAGRDVNKPGRDSYKAEGDIYIYQGVEPSQPKPDYAPPPLPDAHTLPDPGSLPPGSYLPYHRNHLFTGRKPELLALAKSLLYEADGKDVVVTQTAVASGLGGIGKTQLAVEFAHRYGRFFAGGVYWLNMAQAENVPAEIALLGGAGGMQLHDQFETLAPADQRRLIMLAWQSSNSRLLIFDNCEEEAVLKTWRPVSGGCRVLVTSRRGGWSPALGIAQIRLDVLPRAESVAFLRRFVPDLGDDDAEAIAAELGDLPLALHLAGSFLARYGSVVTPAMYLAQLRDEALLNHPSLQGRGAALSPTDHEHHVGRTFALSYDQLENEDETDKVGLALLARAACFALGEALPVALLTATLGIEDEDMAAALLVQDGLARLVSLGLLAQGRAGECQLHRLLAAYVQDALATEIATAQEQVEQVVLDKAYELNMAGYPAPLLAWQSHLRYVTEQAERRGSEQAATLLNNLGYHLQMVADYAGARPYYEQALAIDEKVLGPEHPHTASSLNNLGGLLQETGDYAGARPYLEQVLAIREQVLGPEHPDTAGSLNNLGGLLQATGDYAGAQPYYERALTVNEKVMGTEHPHTAGSLNNLGFLLRETGDYEGARSYLERALAIREKVMGAEHPDTANSLNNLGLLLQATGDYVGARLHLDRALAIREKVMGAEHPHMARSLNNLGFLLKAAGDYEGARLYYERALAIREKVMGAEHPDTANSLNNLGGLLQATGDYAGARLHLDRALAINEKVFGMEHPDTALSLNNLGFLLQATGNYVGARPYYERALVIMEKLLGSDHPHTEVVRRNLTALEEEKDATLRE